MKLATFLHEEEGQSIPPLPQGEGRSEGEEGEGRG